MPEADDIHTEMRCAAKEGDVQKVNNLLKNGANVNSINFHKNTAIHMAVFYGHKDIAEILIMNGADLDLTNANGQTPLQLACCKGYLDIVKMITKHGCDLHAQTDFSGMTALHFASKEGQAEICQHLLDVGAEEEVLDSIDKIAEYYAANYPTELVFKKYKNKKGGKKSVTKQPAKSVPDKSQPASQEKLHVEKSESPKEHKQINKKTESPNVPKVKEETSRPTNTPGSANKKSSVKEVSGLSTVPSEAKEESQTTTKENNTSVGKNENQQMKPENKPSDTSKEENSNQTTKGGTPPSDDTTGQQKAGAGTVKSTVVSDKTKKSGASPEPRESKKIPTYDTAKYDPKGRGFGNHTPGGGVEIPKYKKENYDQERQKQDLEGATARGKITLLKDHSFHWSEEHKSKMKLSVFDRLQGGASRKKTQDQANQEMAKQSSKKGTNQK